MSVSLLSLVGDHLHPLRRNVYHVDCVGLGRLADDCAAEHCEIEAPRGAEESVTGEATAERVDAVRRGAEPDILRSHQNGDARASRWEAQRAGGEEAD